MLVFVELIKKVGVMVVTYRHIASRLK